MQAHLSMCSSSQRIYEPNQYHIFLMELSNLRAERTTPWTLQSALNNGPLGVGHGQECKIILANKPQEVQKDLFPRPQHWLQRFLSATTPSPHRLSSDSRTHRIYVLEYSESTSGATTSLAMALFYAFKLWYLKMQKPRNRNKRSLVRFLFFFLVAIVVVVVRWLNLEATSLFAS